MGATTNTEVQLSIERENDAYADIIQEDFIDSYRNLTIKVSLPVYAILNSRLLSGHHVARLGD